MIFTLLILLIHWVADFLCQTHKMAMNKSNSVLWLSFHVVIYTAVTTLCWSAFFGYTIENYLTTILLIFGITFVTHWITDYFTSKWTSRLWVKKDIHNFFVVVGLDQLIHITTLIITFNFLIEKL